MRCALVSTTLDLRNLLGAELERIADRLEVIDHSAGAPDADVRIACAWHPPHDAFDRYPNLAAVCSIGAGVDNILMCPSLRSGIEVVRVVDPEQAQLMAGFVAWHVIGHQRGLAAYREQQRDRIWRVLGQRSAQSVPVGILGFGAIGQRVAMHLALLGFPVMVWSRTAKLTSPPVRSFHGREGLDAMLGETEVLVNLLPLTGETRDILDGHMFGRMRCGGYLVQVGRGEHLVEDDLLAALESGQLAGAALDVFGSEPLSPTHPFWAHPKIVVTPHAACDASASAVADTLVATADAIQKGERPPNAVDRGLGY
jgi:glyoxylate/hydroxypyruvate reductase